jgi:hypothetical protein
VRLAISAQNVRIWAASTLTSLDLPAAPNGGSRVTIATSDRHTARLPVQNGRTPCLIRAAGS